MRVRRIDWAEAASVLATSARFFGRHYPVVLAFGAVASLQRFLAVGGGERFAFAGGVPGELVTAAARVLFVVWVARRMFAGAGVSWAQVGDRFGRFARSRTGVLLASASMLVALTLVAKVIPDAVVATLPEQSRSGWRSWELAVKNVTVIPFTMVWMTALVRHAALSPVPVSGSAGPRDGA